MKNLLCSVLFALAVLSAYAQDRDLRIVTQNTPNPEQRIALVIGNGAYKYDPLANPTNDAKDMAATLRTLGFDVMHLENVSKTEMKRSIRNFGEKIQKGGVGLFYFAGHGIQVNGKNFLIPVGATINHEYEVEDESVDLDFLLGQIMHAQNRLNIVILDACRNNPFARSFRSTSRGLANVNAPRVNNSPEILIAYATAPGDIASDGDGRNSPYTEELLKYIKEANLKIEEVFKRVRSAVLNKTAGKQTPWESVSIVGDFYFLEKRGPDIAASPIPNTTSNPTDAKSSDIPESEAPPRKTIVLVADFKSLNEENRAVTETIIEQLRDSTKNYNDIEIRGLEESITAQQGPEVARIKGREHKAGIVLWGWYFKTNENIIINVHFEVLQKPDQLFLLKDKHTFILPSGGIESFNMQLRLSGELTYLTLLTTGLARLDIEDYDSAIEHFSIALAQKSVPKDMINPGDIYFYRGLAHLRKSLRDNIPGDISKADDFFADIFRVVAVVGKADNALADINRAIELSPGNIEARLLRANFYSSRREFDKAISDFDHLIASCPQNIFYYWLRSNVYLQKDDPSRKEADLNKASQLSNCDCPDSTMYCTDWFIYYIRATVFLSRENFDQVIVNVDQAIKSDVEPSFLPLLFFLKGGAYEGKKDFSQAYASYDQGLKLNPKFTLLYWIRGCLHDQLKKFDQAIADYDEAIKLSPNLAELYSARGDTYSHKHDYNRAIANYNQAIELDPNNADPYYYCAVAYRRIGKLDQAIARLSQYITLKPSDEDGYSYRAVLYELKQDLDKAISDYNQVIKLKPDDSDAYYNRGSLYQRKGDRKRAIADLSQCIKQIPDFAPAYLQRGLAYIHKDKSRAISDIRMAILLTDSPQIRQQAEQELRRLGVK